MKLIKAFVFSLLFSNLADAELILDVGTWDFPPFTVENSQEPQGIFSEILNTACQNTKVTCKTNSYPYKRMVTMGEAKELDAIYPVVRHEEWIKWNDLSPIIINSSYDIFVLTTDPLKYEKPSDLQNYTTGTLSPKTITYEMLQKEIKDFKGSKAEPEVSVAVALTKLAGGRYANQWSTGAVLTNKDVGADLIRREGMTTIRDAGVFKPNVDFHFAFIKESKNQAAIAVVLTEMKRLMSDKTYVEALRAKYPYDIPLDK